MELTPPRLAPPQLSIRNARTEDAPQLAVAQRAITATPGLLVTQPSEISDEVIARKIAALSAADNGKYLVAEVGGQLVGHAMLDPLPFVAVRHVVHLTMAVHRGFQGRGVGNALLGALVAWARGAPAVEKIELHVRSSNAAALALYAKLGFREVGRYRHRVKVAAGAYLDDVAMELLTIGE
jgi:ribosomal protein S18 acetylase RimI-like enzyme